MDGIGSAVRWSAPCEAWATVSILAMRSPRARRRAPGLDVGRAPVRPDDVEPTLYSARMPAIASVDVPASSANLGSGFDCFAVALSLKMRAELWHGDESGIVLNSRGEGTPRDDEPADDNLLIRAFREGLRISAAPGGASWRLEVSSMIPAARGLGSSAAAIVAGAVLGAAVGRRTGEADRTGEQTV